MASKNNNALGTGLSIIAVLAVGYLAYKWLLSPSAAQAAARTGLPVASYNPATAGMNPNSLLNALQKILGGQQQQGSGLPGIGIGGGPGGGGTYPVLSVLPASLQSQIAAIGGYSYLANNTPLAELGGQSLATYDPGSMLGTGIYIPQQPLQQFDTSQLASPINYGNPFGSNPFSYGSDPNASSLSTTSVDLGALPTDPTQSSSNFDPFAGQINDQFQLSNYGDYQQNLGSGF